MPQWFNHHFCNFDACTGIWAFWGRVWVGSKESSRKRADPAGQDWTEPNSEFQTTGEKKYWKWGFKHHSLSTNKQIYTSGLEYRRDSSADDDSAEHDSWYPPFVAPDRMTSQQSESAQTGLQFGCTDYRASYSGLCLVPNATQRVGKEYYIIVLRNAPLIWTWQMLNVVIG